MTSVSMSLFGALLALVSLAAIDGKEDGLARTPPMGWRSWNLFGDQVSQSLIESQMDGMASRARTVDGVPTSLLDLGYSDVGLDDAWQVCGHNGPKRYTYHDAQGNPIVDESLFPDFKGMTDYAHKLGLTAGWYANNCICEDHCMADMCYENDVKALVDLGFDSVKLDNCGKEVDLQKWSDLMDATSPEKPILIENCHWGLTTPNVTGWCPWHFYRTSMDVRASYDSVIANLMSTVTFAAQNLSYPGCWAYPDMLEVGCQDGPGGESRDPGLSFVEARTHFGAWCIVSSPLVLSHDTTNDTVTDEIWPIISNTEAIAINQAYAGESGTLFASSDEKVVLNLFMSDNSRTQASGVSESELQAANPYSGTLQHPSFNKHVVVGAWQQWSKKLDDKSAAVLILNNANEEQEIDVDFSTIPSLKDLHCDTNVYDVRDVWNHVDLPQATDTWRVKLESHDSALIVLTAVCPVV